MPGLIIDNIGQLILNRPQSGSPWTILYVSHESVSLFLRTRGQLEADERFLSVRSLWTVSRNGNKQMETEDADSAGTGSPFSRPGGWAPSSVRPTPMWYLLCSHAHAFWWALKSQGWFPLPKEVRADGRLVWQERKNPEPRTRHVPCVDTRVVQIRSQPGERQFEKGHSLGFYLGSPGPSTPSHCRASRFDSRSPQLPPRAGIRMDWKQTSLSWGAHIYFKILLF